MGMNMIYMDFVEGKGFLVEAKWTAFSSPE